MRVYTDCLELRSSNRRKIKEREGMMKITKKRNFLLVFFILKIKLNTRTHPDGRILITCNE
jgi:hypothetical protein